MDYEKKYKEVLERARKIYNEHKAQPFDVMLKVFPELKKSEGEKIRKAIIEFFESEDDNTTYSLVPKKDILSWLEKQGEHAKFRDFIQVGDKVTRNQDGVLVNLSQLNRVAKKDEKQGEQKPNPCDGCVNRKGCINCENGELREVEQKPADKVEPKFHEGEWVVSNRYTSKPFCITKICDTYYFVDNDSFILFEQESDWRLWTIQDAKAGDVLATKSGGIFIYKELLYDKPFAYCGVDKFGVFKDCNCGDGLDWTPYLSDVTPATKEQRELLFKKMHDAGYEWDTEKFELRKVESYSLRSIIKDEPSPAIKKVVDSHTAWSEENEGMVTRIVESLSAYADKLQYEGFCHNSEVLYEQINWLKSIKDRVQPKQEWSEEDYNEIETIACYLDNIDNEGMAEMLRNIRDKYYHIIPQTTWKPSEEHIRWLRWAINRMPDTEIANEAEAVLEELLEQLKKLK